MKTYAYLLSNYLFNGNYISRDDQDRLLVALMELLINAIEHGNCKITYKTSSPLFDSITKMKRSDRERFT